MSFPNVTSLPATAPLLWLAGCGAGFALGLLYFGALRWSVRRLCAGRGAGMAALAALARFALLGVALVGIARAGAGALLAAAVGLWLARLFSVRRARRESA